MKKPKQVKLTLIKQDVGIIAENELDGRVDLFDNSEEARMNFMKYMLDEFINKEVLEGPEYK